MQRMTVLSVVVHLLTSSGAWAQVAPPLGNQGLPRAPAAAAAGGEHYHGAISSAWLGQGSLSPVFSYEIISWFKGQARDEHHQLLLALLRHVGDERFALALGG